MSTSSRPKRTRPTKCYKEAESSDEQDYYQSDGVDEDSFESGPTTPKKRKISASGKTKTLAKTIPKQPRRKKERSLKHVLHLPPEIQDEILGHLSPEILVLLLQVKPFRERLIGPGANHIWKSVRINAGMPELQAKDITERQYLTLVFDKHCHDCGTPDVDTDYLDLRACTRLCIDCKENTTYNRDYEEIIKELHPEAIKCAKGLNLWAFELPRGVNQISEDLSRMSPQEVEKFVSERQALKKQISADAKAIYKWLRNREDEEYEKIREVQKMRRQQIHEKLLEEGWMDESLPRGWDSEKQIAYSTKLNKSSWTRIKRDLQGSLRRKLLKQRRNDRAGAVKEAYFAYLQANDDPLFPSFKKFSDFLPIKTLLAVHKTERPELESLVKLDQTEWEAALLSSRLLIDKYEQAMCQHAINRLNDAYNARKLPVPKDPISAQRSYFRYYQGTPRGHWPNIPEQVAKFPEIHAIMRDRQAGKNVFRHLKENRAAEFGEVTKLSDRRNPYSGGLSDEWLDVDLDYEN